MDAEVPCHLPPTPMALFCKVDLTGPRYLPSLYNTPGIPIWYCNRWVFHLRAYSYNTFIPTHLHHCESGMSVLVGWLLMQASQPNGLLYVRGCIYTYLYICTHICTVLVYRRLGIILLKSFLLNLQLEVGRVLLNIAYLFQAPKLNACSHLWNLVCCFGVKYFPLTHLHATTLRKFRCGCLLQVLLSIASLWKLLEVRNIAVI